MVGGESLIVIHDTATLVLPERRPAAKEFTSKPNNCYDSSK